MNELSEFCHVYCSDISSQLTSRARITNTRTDPQIDQTVGSRVPDPHRARDSIIVWKSCSENIRAVHEIFCKDPEIAVNVKIGLRPR